MRSSTSRDGQKTQHGIETLFWTNTDRMSSSRDGQKTQHGIETA